MTPPRPAAPRVRLLDALRGFSLVSMVAYHAMYDLVYMFGINAPWYRALPGYVWQQSICWVFILVAGAAVHYGRHRLRHALVVLGCAAALTLVTALAMPGMLIAFGVLHMLGCCMLLAALCWPLLQKIPPSAGVAVSAALFVFTKCLPRGALGFLDWPLVRLPAALYRTKWLFWLGLPGPGFASSDYFPLLPWVFLFFAGFFGWALVKGRAALARPAPRGRNPLEWLGRHSLPVYMAHQPATLGLLLGLQALGVFNR